jgi:hypothetical protein
MGFHMRHGWTYGLFAGIVAFPLAVLFAWTHVTHDVPTLLRIATAMSLGAVVAARVAGWLAVLAGCRDHARLAAAFTAILYIVFCGALAVILGHLSTLSSVAAGRLDPSELINIDPWTRLQQQGRPAFAWWFVKESLGAMFFVVLFYAPWTIVPACVLGTLAFGRLLRIPRAPRDNLG